jgi:Kdo2-lipid IVA lauroyltransferase/acyltransferase
MMYYVVYGLLYLLSLLPWFVMYAIADLLTFLVFNVAGYRKDVVMSNLAIAFPEKSIAERSKIAKGFYRLLMDTLVEAIKLISLSKEGLNKKFTGDAEILNELMDQIDRPVQVMAMHNFNWEIVNLGIVQKLRHPFIGVYMPIKNKIFERLMVSIRARYGTLLVPATSFKKEFPKYQHLHHILALVADQNPGDPNIAHWFPFFGKMTPFVKGAERGARISQSAVVFGHFYPVRRGYYTFSKKFVTMNAAELPEGELTRMYVEYVEECIRKHPENYLWSHRRWKHSK